jgi:hypothetical protein
MDLRLPEFCLYSQDGEFRTKFVNISKRRMFVHRHDILQSTDHKIIPVNKAVPALAKDFPFDDELLLPTLKVVTHCPRSLHITRNASCFQSACNSKTVSDAYSQQSPAPHQ